MPQALTELRDDPITVPDNAILYRRVVWSKIGGREKCPPGDVARLNGNCFTDWPEEEAAKAGFAGPCMSVGVSTVLESLGYEPDRLLDGYPGCGLACVVAGVLRNLTRADGSPCPQGVMLAPTEREPWHGVVFDLSGGRRSGAARNAIAQTAKWSIPLINDEVA
jgi:hypothetical protein